jgi:protocatechuate 3,4-dioxygenase beta subunit
MPHLVALALAVLLQTPAAPVGAAVSGRVLERETQTPIAGAEVTLVPARSGQGSPFAERGLIAITDRDGRYTFGDVEPGRYRVTVQKTGFVSNRFIANPPAFPEADVAAGQRLVNVNVSIERGAVITGRVIDQDGQPVAETDVMVLSSAPSRVIGRGGPVLINSGPSGRTNDLGEFRIYGLRAGEYYVQAMPRRSFDSRPSGGGTTTIPTYFPGTLDAAGAQPLSLSAGQTLGDVEIRLLTAPAFQVTGMAVDDSGMPVANAMVRLTGDDPNGASRYMIGRLHASRTDASGRFSIGNVTSGTYTLLIAAPVVIAGPPDRGAGFSGAGGSMGIVSGSTRGPSGTRVTTEIHGDVTIQYRDDTATRVEITVGNADITRLEVIVRR